MRQLQPGEGKGLAQGVQMQHGSELRDPRLPVLGLAKGNLHCWFGFFLFWGRLWQGPCKRTNQSKGKAQKPSANRADAAGDKPGCTDVVHTHAQVGIRKP